MPTIADKLYRVTLRGKRVNPEYKQYSDIVTMPKFVLEEGINEMLMKMTIEVQGTGSERDLKRIDNARKMARLPFKRAWVEISRDLIEKSAKDRMSLPTRPTGPEGELIQATRGWLLEQHPSDPMICSMQPFLTHDTEDATVAYPYRCVWSLDDTTVPDWPGEAVVLDTRQQIGSSALVGVEGYDTYQCGIFTNWVTRQGNSLGATMSKMNPDVQEDIMRFVELFNAELLVLWIFLMTIDELPVISRDVKPSKGFLARGQYRKFLSHRTITLTIPIERATKRLANHLLTPSRHRRHQVRGFWRRLTQDRSDTCRTIDHDWFVEGKRRLCLDCGAEGTFVEDHERGSALLGYVTHDYHVKKGSPS